MKKDTNAVKTWGFRQRPALFVLVIACLTLVGNWLVHGASPWVSNRRTGKHDSRNRRSARTT